MCLFDNPFRKTLAIHNAYTLTFGLFLHFRRYICRRNEKELSIIIAIQFLKLAESMKPCRSTMMLNLYQ